MSEVNFEAIGGRVMTELHRRLATPELARDLPGTLLMKVAMDYVKHLEKRNELIQQQMDKENEDPLTVVMQPGLPIEMQFEILDTYTDELEAAWRAASLEFERVIAEIGGEEDGSDGDVVQDVQAVDPEGE